MWNSLVNHLWQSTLFVAVIAGLCFLLRRDNAHLRYWLWWTASLKFLLPFSLLTALGSWFGLRAEIGAAPAVWSNTVTVVAQPFAASADARAPGILLLAVWAVGSSACLITWWLRARRLRRVLGTARRDFVPLTDGGRRFDVYRTEEPIEPGVVGIVRSALILPCGIEQRLGARQLDAVLAHEFCHIRRRDNLTAAVHMLVEVLFWFHPLVWWIGARLIDERERACDEMVVTLGHDRATYAEGILDVCEQYVAAPLRCAAGISGGDLKTRITQIMRYRGMQRIKRIKKCVLGTIALLTLALPVVAGFVLQQPALAQDSADTAPERAPGPPPERLLNPSPSDPGPGLRPGPEYLPIVKVAPIYPPRAAARGLEGYVIVQYTVKTDGATEDVVVLESSTNLFDRSAIESVQKYRYRPLIVDGAPVEVPGVVTRIEFVLEPPAPPATGADGTGDSDEAAE